MTKKLGTVALTASVLWAVISLVVKSGIGISQTFPVTADFNFTGATAQIIHETADQCFLSAPGFVSCGQFLTAFNVLPGGGDSDSYDILANLAVLSPTEFPTDLNHTIQLALSPGTCASANLNSLPPGSWLALLPGADLHHVSNKNFDIYNFEGNIPTSSSNGFNETIFFPTFDHIEFNLKIPTAAPGNSTLSLQGNANLCGITGPMALSVAIQDFDGDIDSSCVNISTPQYSTLDISQVVCGFLR